MTPHDHDDSQSDAPDLGAAVQLDNAETLDGAVGGDALDAGYVPPDRPYALDEDTAPDTLDERLAREQPEELPAVDEQRSGRLTIADEGSALETPDSMDGVEVGVDGGAASAEEAAVHDVDGDTRVDGEPSVADDPRLADPELDASLAPDDPADDRARRDASEDVSEVLDGADTGTSSGL